MDVASITPQVWQEGESMPEAYRAALVERLHAARLRGWPIVTAADANRFYPKAEWKENSIRHAFQPKEDDQWAHAGGIYGVNLSAWKRVFHALNMAHD